ncbi:unnamed protein product, partial [Ascophyllum nodosum]
MQCGSLHRFNSKLLSKMWGKLMPTAEYLSHEMPHSRLDMETSSKRLYGKDVDLSHLKIISAGDFVGIKDVETFEPKPWKGMPCGFGENETIFYWVWNLKTLKIVKSMNVALVEN